MMGDDEDTGDGALVKSLSRSLSKVGGGQGAEVDVDLVSLISSHIIGQDIFFQHMVSGLLSVEVPTDGVSDVRELDTMLFKKTWIRATKIDDGELNSKSLWVKFTWERHKSVYVRGSAWQGSSFPVESSNPQ